MEMDMQDMKNTDFYAKLTGMVGPEKAEVIAELLLSYCPDCLSADKDCQCWNDE